ncbi:Uncharacterized protein TCM_033012 [Theobroma cacao]|uniref:Uncharacterized protein n=1 Tax=Theobroma cacao TaxID=3641 RepID=A0A061FB84_THECC|nr:Uncharacterized protein TCM_033012 [Theobroma cacao]
MMALQDLMILCLQDIYTRGHPRVHYFHIGEKSSEGLFNIECGGHRCTRVFRWIITGVNIKVVDHFIDQHAIKEVFNALMDGAKHVIHDKFGEVNTMVVFDVKDELKVLLGKSGVI